ncbi:3D domain-containing protein [Tamlana sp. I1]|uniref:3D domain-containing protein n=1 Tax=Tamlana sp. I1 TaxID=2762061 RepID=UPI001E461108|nr:3D domain-containing protein [Tamlana sp. I1]
MRLFLLFILCVVCSCKEEDKTVVDHFVWGSKIVTASAYNSIPAQTSPNPHITAFGDSLYPGLKYIAVSRDLLHHELKYNTLVKIEGLEGVYIVKDKMHSRWKNHIDIYMGLDVDAALQWGRRKVCIDYGMPEK